MEEPGFRVVLTEAGERTTELVMAVRAVTGLSLWDSKLLLDTAPVAVAGPAWLDVAQDTAALLRDAGAHATVLCDWCDRTLPREALVLDPTPCRGPWPNDTCPASSSPITD
ncbi:ribosomal protein L7/L12 [Streptomyces sp. NPDC058662]|uniref:ribosomal protein L7/L12 n=1 Tax=Streptomyces sp. NPDC058662 TaxID=3346583 RepID=UPI00365CEEAB